MNGLISFRTILPLAIVLGLVCTSVSAKNSPAQKSNRTKAVDSSRNEGAKLFKANCQNCHSTGESGGCLGPVLAGEGSRRSKFFIESRISNDPKMVQEFLRAYGHAELMPHMRVDSIAAKKLASYVASLAAVESGFDVKSHEPQKKRAQLNNGASAQSIANGKRLVYERGCLMCHSFGGMGGQFAPAFDGIGARHSKEFIAESISSAELFQGNSGREYGARGLVMPPSSFSEEEIESIASYLSSLK
ncbi:MAG TPA: cytochrome c [Candidatus Melainabacteria bacterium]|jgi:nitric oxide reductase subunit C|nr:cytochrome c [Candidatus Melainabacteria bacterium]HIN63174.1 cytochrome c [Candidatus Obscuribacterales bacterium]